MAGEKQALIDLFVNNKTICLREKLFQSSSRTITRPPRAWPVGLWRDMLDYRIAANEVLTFRYKGRIGTKFSKHMLMGMTRIKDNEDFLGPIQNLLDLTERVRRRAASFN